MSLVGVGISDVWMVINLAGSAHLAPLVAFGGDKYLAATGLLSTLVKPA